MDIARLRWASCLYGPDGTLLAQASAPNPQAGWGADVISRIEAALHGSGDALARLRARRCAGTGVGNGRFSAYLR